MNKVLLTIAASTVALVATQADATTVLYRNDFSVGTDYLGQALSSSPYTVTSTTGSIGAFTLSSYDLIVYASQNNSAPSPDLTALNSYITAGGKVIFTSYTSGSPSLDATLTGTRNQTVLNLGSQFSSGLVSPLAVTNTGWGTFSTGLSATSGGTVAGTFGNGEAAIVIGNGGRTIYNGFLSDTVASSQLYTNQLSSLLSTSAVPEPSTWAMMIFGMAMVGAALRTRRTQPKVNFAF